MNYTPTPLDTSAVELPPVLLQLTERLAKNNHDLWARARFTEGWSYGPKRDDTAKTHPCLIPYEKLPESEREYDRITAIGALKTIVAMGYTITQKAHHNGFRSQSLR